MKRYALAAGISACSIASPVAASSIQVQSYLFDIPAQELDDALRVFAQKTRLQLIFAGDAVHGKRSRPLRGRHSADAGIAILLQGTGLKMSRTSEGVLVVAPSPGVSSIESSIEADEVEETSEIVVTGSLIANPNLRRSAPVKAVSAREAELRGSNTAEQMLRDMPGVVPDMGSSRNQGNRGASFVNLRGLGNNRNLVLIDGARLVPAEVEGRFDLNNVPLALIQRTDVLTGGASTTYGADAVSGVVNFIARSRFTGVELSMSEQVTERGDGNAFRADLTAGFEFDDGRGNLILAGGY